MRTPDEKLVYVRMYVCAGWVLAPQHKTKKTHPSIEHTTPPKKECASTIYTQSSTLDGNVKYRQGFPTNAHPVNGPLTFSPRAGYKRLRRVLVDTAIAVLGGRGMDSQRRLQQQEREKRSVSKYHHNTSRLFVLRFDGVRNGAVRTHTPTF